MNKKQYNYKIDKLNTWRFGINNNELVNLVLSGKKTATTSLYDKNDIPAIGEESILTFLSGEAACITKTKEVIITEFKNITWDLAKLEGENNSLKEWQDEHRRFFKSINKNFCDETMVIFEIFEIKK